MLFQWNSQQIYCGYYVISINHTKLKRSLNFLKTFSRYFIFKLFSMTLNLHLCTKITKTVWNFIKTFQLSCKTFPLTHQNCQVKVQKSLNICDLNFLRLFDSVKMMRSQILFFFYAGNATLDSVTINNLLSERLSNN